MWQGLFSQSRLILTGLGALLASAAALSIAGIYLGSVREVLGLIPGLMVLLPSIINMRGSIAGVFASRLSSSMHLGEFSIDFQEGSVLGDNIRASLVVTILIAFALGIFAYALSTLCGFPVVGVTDLVLISVVCGVVSGLVVMGITLVVALTSYRYGLDLDMIAAPTVTTSGDIVTLPILVLSATFVMLLSPPTRLVLVAVAVATAIVIILYTRRRLEGMGAIVRENLFLLVPLSTFGTLAGLTYSLNLDNLLALAVFLILIPPFMGGLGSIGGILGSRLSTEMHTGEVNPSFLPERGVVHHFIISYLYTLILLPLLALIAHSAAVLMGLNSPGLGMLVIISLVAGLAVMTLVNAVAYATASLSFRYGLDPDNFGIPVITSLIDLIGAATLVAAIDLLL
ncbi:MULTISPECIES: magnesium transporter [unclassified Methanoculleus]|uniref:magnesium transporter n=1 Tax=unclassified Methanoculleus TaxID=2619537 RepID=UPI0025E5DA8A|nr:MULTISPECIES: magnesium transporter [unclassified Methanoculleus]MCK9317334.1 magnesium transporter [Methanoculleus sp.]MDD2253036.1 magnesium transporter [Methanoculleus sp.]MDD2786632.1 magnesium transporter [Methanoculleus sp.]MDD3216233.1 magnesium transporter [Methanoculleus sp.]MDD4313882.1 magnesium transporter [Methanoculleus sp.]